MVVHMQALNLLILVRLFLRGLQLQLHQFVYQHPRYLCLEHLESHQTWHQRLTLNSSALNLDSNQHASLDAHELLYIYALFAIGAFRSSQL